MNASDEEKSAQNKQRRPSSSSTATRKAKKSRKKALTPPPAQELAPPNLAVLWTDTNNLPLPPTGCQPFETQHQWYRYNLSESLLHAVRTNNIDLVRNIFGSFDRKNALTFLKNELRSSIRNATAARSCKLQGLPQLIQPNFELRELIWTHPDSPALLMRQNLVTLACEHGHVPMVKTFYEFGFDMNLAGPTPRGSPLMTAIRFQQDAVVKFLLKLPNCILTDHSMETIWSLSLNLRLDRNSHSRYSREETALSRAAAKGNITVVQWLIDAGGFDSSSTKRPDDPYPLLNREYSHDLAQLSLNIKYSHDLAQLSVHEAVYEAHKQAGDVHNPKYEESLEILELLIFHMGSQNNNAISKYILDGIRNNQWQDDFTGRGLSAYHYSFDEDRDFDDENTASPRAVAIARGLRYQSMECLFAAGIILTKEGLERAQDKFNAWKDIAFISKQRLDEESSISNTTGEQEEQPTTDQRQEMDRLDRRRRMLQWCQLFTNTARPWSRENHYHFPKPVRCLARELLWIGSALARRHDNKSAGSLRELWENEILPSVVA